LSIKTTHTTRDLVHGRLAHQPTPPGETGPDRLAVPAHRQAPAVPDPTVFFSSPPGGAHRAARRRSVQPSHARTIAWRLSVDRQAPYQNYTFLVYGTPVNLVYHLNPFHGSHKNPNLNSQIGKPTNILYKQLHVP